MFLTAYRLDCLNSSAGYNTVTTRTLHSRMQQHHDALKSVRSSVVADQSLRTDGTRRKLVLC